MSLKLNSNCTQINTSVFLKTNLGSIVIRDTVSKDIQGVIAFDSTVPTDEFGTNITSSASYTVPANTTTTILNVLFSTTKNHEAEIILLSKLENDAGFVAVGEFTTYQNLHTFDLASGPLTFPALSDIKIIGRSNNSAVQVSAGYSILEVTSS